MHRRHLALLPALVVAAACAGAGADGVAVPEVTTGSEVDTRDQTSPFTEGDSTDSTPGSVDTTTSTNQASTTTTSDPPTTTSSTPDSTIPPPSTTTSTTTSTVPTPAPTTTPITVPAPEPTDPQSPCPPTGSHVWVNRPASTLAAPALPDGWRTDSAGASAVGRDLTLLVREVDAPTRTVVVIGGIHGNEPVSPPTVRAMVEASIPDDTEVWLLPLLNPDGSVAGTRCNSLGVDLNRNFSWTWRADDGGPGPFSEPEPQAARSLVERLDPDLVVWVHQPLGYVSSIGDTPDVYEQAWSAASGTPVRPNVSQHGGGESWTAFGAGIPSMLIEIDTWDARADMVAAHVAGFDALLDVVIAR